MSNSIPTDKTITPESTLKEHVAISRSEMIIAGFDPEATYYDLKGNIIYEPKGIPFAYV